MGNKHRKGARSIQYKTKTKKTNKMMISKSVAAICCTLLLSIFSSVQASVFLPYDVKASVRTNSFKLSKAYHESDFTARRSKEQLMRMRRAYSGSGAAMAIPGYGLAEQVFVGGFMNFLSIYNLVITARILLSWFPQAQGIGALQPVFAITDPYLNLFRGIIPPVFGLDLSPILAFFLLNVLTNATAAIGAELTPEMKKKLKSHNPFSTKKNKFPMQQI